jgi:recombination protein RecT
MSTNALKEKVTGGRTSVANPDDKKNPVDRVAAMLASPSMQAQIKAALPRHMTPERLARIVTTEIRKVPKLAECTPVSFFGAVIQCAQLGLEPGNALGHAYILPYDRNMKVGNEWKKIPEAQLIIGYRGMIDLARRSGQIQSLNAVAVYQGDEFKCEFGLEPTLRHVPDFENPDRENPEHLTFVYAVAKLKDGGTQFAVMSRAQINAIRARSQGYTTAARKVAEGKKGDNPWITDYEQMALKTVVRRLFKFLPVSIEIQTAVGLDERADAGLPQDMGAVIDGQFTPVDDEPEFVDQATGEITDQRQHQAENTIAYQDVLSQIQKATDVELAALALDSGRNLPEGDFVKLQQAFEDRKEILLRA